MTEVLVEVSARHLHLTEEDFKILFGQQKNLNSVKKLSQEDDFAAEEKVNISGPKGMLDGIRIVGPFRKYSQVEITFSEARILGIEPPLRVSGILPGALIKVTGPAGQIEKEIAIIAQRHLHLPPEQAESLGVKDGDIVKVSCQGQRETTFGQIIVRVKPKYTFAVHLDTDEANAAGIISEGKAELII